MTVANVRMNATILCANAYYDETTELHVLKIQLFYKGKFVNQKRYQAVTFLFTKPNELKRCVDDFKAFLDLKHLSDVNNRDVSVLIYQEGNYKCAEKSELVSMYIEGERTERVWFPMGHGILDDMTESQTVFAY